MSPREIVSLLFNDKPVVSHDKPVVSHDKPVVSHDKPGASYYTSVDWDVLFNPT